MSDGPRSGKLLRSRGTRSAVLYEAVYPCGLHMPMHSHEPAHLSIVLSGGFEETLPPLKWQVGPGRVLFRPAEGEHDVRFGPVHTHILSVQLRSSVTDYARDAKIPISQPADLSGTRSSWLVARIHDEFRSDDSVSDLAIDALILDMLVELGRAKFSDTSDVKIKKVEERLRENLNRKISMDELAKEVGMHPMSLARAFRRVHRTTIGTYVRRLRLERATQLLTHSNLSLAEIARELGFADQSHFSRVFKAETGFTPSVCQKTRSCR